VERVEHLAGQRSTSVRSRPRGVSRTCCSRGSSCGSRSTRPNTNPFGVVVSNALDVEVGN
jgi:hypothetical protein